MAGTTQHPLAKHGRMDDSLMAHVAHGEMIVPAPVLASNPELVSHIEHAIKGMGADPSRYVVGDGMSINPITGQPEFGFFSSIFKIFRSFLPAIATAITGNPMIGAALGAGLGATKGGGIPGALMGAAGGYFGGSGLNGAISGVSGLPAGSTIGSMIGAGVKGAASGMSNASSVLGNALGIGAETAGTAGKVLGALSSANSLGGQSKPSTPAKNPAQAVYRGGRPPAMQRPESLMDYSGFSQEQERSALATRGLNTGLGEEENDYYRNLLQRALIGKGAPKENFLMPVEQTYFGRQGYRTNNARALLGDFK